MENRFIEGRVSVITPVYNAERYLREMLESVYQQGYSDIEIVLVDDQSSDNSAMIIQDEMKNHSEILYSLQPQNMGAGVARNKAMELATGQYVAFLDSDDVWEPCKISKQIQLMREKKTPFSYAAIEMINEDGNVIKGIRKVKEKCDYKYL